MTVSKFTKFYKMPLVGGGPIGPKFVFVFASDTFADVDDDEVLALDVTLLFNVVLVALETLGPLILLPMTFVVDFIIKNFSSLAIMCLP